MSECNYFIAVSKSHYNGPNGLTLSKEIYGQSPSSIPAHLWVVRDPDGEYLDHDKNKHTLVSRHSCIIQ